MNLRLCYFVSFLLSIPSFGQEAAPPRELIIAAVGEIPIPRLRVAEAMGRLGYEADESSSNRWFPKQWILTSEGKGVPLKLGLNIEPVATTVPAGATGVVLTPADGKADDASQKPLQLPGNSAEEPALLLLFNRAPHKPWSEGYATHLLSCAKLDPAAPTAVILNLSGATLTVTGSDRLKTQLAPGKSTIAPIFVNAQRGFTLLPLSASAEGRIHTLDVCPLESRAPYCPVVVVYPSAELSKQSRPLKVSVVQPSAAPVSKSAIATAP
jgi:hypothetical protein